MSPRPQRNVWKCPRCGVVGPTRTQHPRIVNGGTAKFRRRKSVLCGHVWSSREAPIQRKGATGGG